MRRRDFVKGSAALAGASAVGAFSLPKFARAAKIEAPVVDKLTMWVLVLALALLTGAAAAQQGHAQALVCGGNFVCIAEDPAVGPGCVATHEPRLRCRSVAPEPTELTCQHRCPEALESDVDTLTLTLLHWIVAKTGLTAPEPPRVSFVPEYQMTHLFDAASNRDRKPQADVPAIQGEGGAHPAFRVQALYLRATATVYLPETWRPGGLRDQSILLHELVHHVQRFNKVVPVCPAALERQAYELQATWLREQGAAEPYKLIGTDEFTVLMRTACIPPDW